MTPKTSEEGPVKLYHPSLDRTIDNVSESQARQLRKSGWQDSDIPASTFEDDLRFIDSYEEDDSE